LATLVRTVPATAACIRIRSRRADIGIAEATDPVNGPGVCVATRGDFRSHQWGPQLAIPVSFLVATNSCSDTSIDHSLPCKDGQRSKP
jgi:hypothetical protein